MAVTVTLKVSNTQNYADSGLPAQMPLPFITTMGGTTFLQGSDGRTHVIVFPSYFYTEPVLPALEYVEVSRGEFQLVGPFSQAALGVARATARLDASTVVVVDHGLEISGGFGGPNGNWPMGNVWLAQDKGDGVQLTRLTDFPAFNHSVAVGDLNGDGRKDILVGPMGTKIGGPQENLHALLQQSNGSFAIDTVLSGQLSGQVLDRWGIGAVGMADLNGDGRDEVIAASYVQSGFGALRVMTRDAAGTWQLAVEMPRAGMDETMGATQIRPLDYDMDGDLDLLVSYEGPHPTLGGVQGFDIFRNDGAFALTRVGASLFADNVWSANQFPIREVEVTDFNFDGYPDLVLQYFSGSAGQVASQDIGTFLLENNAGKGFTSLAGANAALQFPDNTVQPTWWRLMDSAEGVTRLFGMNISGRPMTVDLQVAGRDVGETLRAGGNGTLVMGFGGNDIFNVNGTALRIDGGSGVDTAVFEGPQSAHAVAASGTSLSVDTHTLQHVERLQFSDKKIALDLAPDGNAGKSLQFIGMMAYGLVKTPNVVGTILSIFDQGKSMGEVCQLAIDVGLTRDLAGSSSNLDLAKLVFRNVVGSEASAGDAAALASYIQGNGGTLTQADFLATVAQLDLNNQHIGLVGLQQTGIEYLI